MPDTTDEWTVRLIYGGKDIHSYVHQGGTTLIPYDRLQFDGWVYEVQEVLQDYDSKQIRVTVETV